MARYTDPYALVRAQKSLFAAVEARAKVLHRRMVVEIAKTVTADLLSGTTTTKELRNAGHPFARRKLSRRGYSRTSEKRGHRLSEKVSMGYGQAFPLLPINKQTGRLARSMRLVGAIAPSSAQALSLTMTAPYAPFILGPKGTRRMVARGFQAAKRRIDKKANTKLQHELKRMILAAAVRGRI